MPELELLLQIYGECESIFSRQKVTAAAEKEGEFSLSVGCSFKI